MTVLDYIFIGLSIIWVGEFLLFKSRKTEATDEADGSSFPWILISVIAVVAISLVSREFGILATEQAGIQTIGVVLVGLGIFLRYWGIMELGKQFTRDVQVRDGDKLVSKGPYRILRHPLYTGLFSIVLGFSVYTGSILGVVTALLFFTPLLLRRMQLEENMLIGAFGPEYKTWRESRYRLFPFIY
ncbi:isoprenylcysteine carboxylmethyltransferase family protein [Paenalkalicoccus suaedae]|uniref:Isoprenylcysteine carboxylmethyltransferase family protein n=1 Tax=Paenalkalicoccus suaedae TaxID=2592382 RepID=A0A859FIX3_9BACI|nr:isoprenylcysteine carboxylmethyltransferase family protein [Paenalkalicoccus suaedae]QKS72255.1 isoprenylcysteine carboxylmethyltransferase family protein [Paenalkalicoccus suaedae]